MSSRTLASKFARDGSGALIVELALVLPIVLITSIGALELGLYVFEANAAAKATQLGARWAVVNPPISTTFQAQLKSTTWWQPGTLGQSCQTVAGGCQPSAAVQCTSGAAGCTMTGILTEMQRAYPQLQAGDIVVRYEPFPTSGALGFVGRPGGIPVD